MPKPKHEARTLLLTALCAAGVLLCVYAALGVWPFGTGSVLTGDLNGQYISYNASFARAIFAGGDGMAYTLQKQMGGSMLGILAYYCASPLNLLYLLVPTVHFAKMAGLVLALKVIGSAVAMAFFLGRHDTTLRHRAALPALGYAFCAYVFVYAQNIMWMDVVVLLPLVCYGVDMLIATRRPFVFALALGVAIFANFYIAYMACVFTVLYFGLCMLNACATRCAQAAYAQGEANGNAPAALSVAAGGDSAHSARAFWLSRCGSFAFGALCAGGMACVLIVPAMADISQNKGLAEAFSFTGQADFKLTELFYRLLPFNFTWADAENGLPNVYCGTLIVVLAVLYFCSAGIARREKIHAAAMTVVLFLTLYSADAALAMHGFVKPVWFPYRHAFLFSFWLVFLAARALSGAARLSWRGILCGGAAGLAFLSVCFFVRNVWFTATLFGIGALLCGACLVLFVLLKKANNRRVRALCLAALGVLCCAELGANAFFNANQFEKYSETGFTSLANHGAAALAAIDARAAQTDVNGNARDAYRTEKAFYRSYNDPMLLDYNGLSHFGSTQDSTVVMWLSHLGFGNTNAYAPGSTAFAESLCGLRWLFARSADYLAANGGTPQGRGEVDAVSAHWDAFGETDDGLTLYENATALPLAFYAPLSLQNSGLSLTWDTGMCRTFDTQNEIYAALSQKNAPLFIDLKVSATLDGKPSATQTGEFGNKAVFTAEVPRDGLVYAVFESKTQNPVLLEGDAPDTGYFAGRSGGVLQLGRRTAGERVSVTMLPEWGLADVTKVRFAVMEEKMLADLSEALTVSTPQISTTAGTVTVRTQAGQAERLLVLSVPYSESLVLTVNGARAEPMPLLSNSYCGVLLPAGEHTVSVHYAAKGAGAGLALTCISLAALVGAWLWLRKRRASPKAIR